MKYAVIWYANDTKFLDFFEYMFLVSYFNIVLITQSSFWLACNYLLMNYVSNYLSIHKSSVAAVQNF